jgi:hypothetical protein
MKTTQFSRVLLCAITITALSVGGRAFADDHHDAWSHDHDGYWDDHGQRHAFIEHDHHHGYWRENNGARVFINID